MNTTGLLALVGAVCFLEYNSKKINGPAPVFVADELPGNLNAMCVPPFGVFVKKGNEENEQLLQHEFIHWEQFRTRGLLPFYLEYVAQYLVNGYDAHPMEREARFNECEFCQDNYTECVRQGLAKTVYNPSFR
jgi:hypothetical protein